MSVVIKVENLSKQYRLGQVGTGTISHDVNRWWHRIRGKEDPYLKIGESNDRTTKGDSDYVWALKDINFEVKQGEVLGIIGRNGAGKSTLLKILSRTTAPTTGSVKIKGRVASLLEVGTGFHPELSGRDNIFLNGAILGMSRKEIQSKFDEIVDFSGVERYIDTPVKRYSSGMYVRLAFAVAAHLEPEILIVDEVLAVGDAEFQKRCLGKMKDVSVNQGRTVLFVSHNIESIKKLCKSGLFLKTGVAHSFDDIENCYTEYLKSLNKPILNVREINNYFLNDFLEILEFSISQTTIRIFDDLKFLIKFRNHKTNVIDCVAILIYDEEDKRVAIVDLRSSILLSSTSNEISIKGFIERIPLLRGEYRIGLAIGSTICTGDFFNLLPLTVREEESKKINHFPNNVMGKFAIKANFEISK